jgi:hypothetical protein
MRWIMSGRGFIDYSESREQTNTYTHTHTHTQGSYRVRPGLITQLFLIYNNEYCTSTKFLYLKKYPGSNLIPVMLYLA